MIEHHSAVLWTELKLDAVHYYLNGYTKALSRKIQLDFWYVEPGLRGSGAIA
jgi:hypothetical protein